jgi:drug/metabolite transporter (DMT)-like permease
VGEGSVVKFPPGTAGGSRASVHAALLLVQVAFGSLAVEGKLAMSPRFGVSPAALAMVRILGAALFFAAGLHLQRLIDRRAAPPRVASWRDRLALAGLALFGIVLNQALFLAGLQRTTPISATLLVATIPVFSAAVAAVSGRERLTARGASGIALALLGIAVLSRFAIPEVGDLLVLLNAFSYAFYVVFAKGPLARYGTLPVMAWTFGFGALIFAPVGGVALVRDAPIWSPGAVALVAYVVGVPTVLAYGLNAWALRRAGPALVTIYIYLQPLIVVTLAWLQLGQPLEGRALVAGLLILGGVTVVASAPRQPERA